MSDVHSCATAEAAVKKDSMVGPLGVMVVENLRRRRWVFVGEGSYMYELPGPWPSCCYPAVTWCFRMGN